MKIYHTWEELVGHTPLLRLCRTEEKCSLCGELYAKLEYFNPAGSVKDRAALTMIREAEKSGALKPGGVIIETTSGNTGIGLAAAAIPMGYRVILVMPDTMSVERRKLLASYGAEIVLTDGKKGMSGTIEKAGELLKEHSEAFLPRQFDNPANALAHYETTGPEIFSDLDGEVDVFVATVGTGGTLTGTARYLKEQKPSVKIIAVEPDDSPLLSKGYAAPHKLQGIGANFIPSLLDCSLYDAVMTVTTEEAYAASRGLAKTEGILVGISSGAALSVACKLSAEKANAGKKIVVLLPDGGDRYLSTDLFE